MGKWADTQTLEDIIQATELILRFTASMDLPAFTADEKSQSAVLMQFIIIGEAAGRLSEFFCEKHDDIPWHHMRGMRNRLVHAYQDIDLTSVWETIRSDLPNLLMTLKEIRRL